MSINYKSGIPTNDGNLLSKLQLERINILIAASTTLQRFSFWCQNGFSANTKCTFSLGKWIFLHWVKVYSKVKLRKQNDWMKQEYCTKISFQTIYSCLRAYEDFAWQFLLRANLFALLHFVPFAGRSFIKIYVKLRIGKCVQENCLNITVAAVYWAFQKQYIIQLFKIVCKVVFPLCLSKWVFLPFKIN